MGCSPSCHPVNWKDVFTETLWNWCVPLKYDLEKGHLENTLDMIWIWTYNENMLKNMILMILDNVGKNCGYSLWVYQPRVERSTMLLMGKSTISTGPFSSSRSVRNYHRLIPNKYSMGGLCPLIRSQVIQVIYANLPSPKILPRCHNYHFVCSSSQQYPTWLVVSNMTGLFSISYMGCHPKPIDELIFFKMVIAPPTSAHHPNNIQLLD